MKRTSLIISMLVLAVTMAFAQDVNVPKIVKAAFDKKFPDAENPVWKKAKENFQVQFKYDTKHHAHFTADGKWLKTAAVITEEDLPATTSEYLLDNYEEFEIKQIQEISTNKGETSYMLILMVGEDKVKLNFNEEGEYIEK